MLKIFFISLISILMFQATKAQNSKKSDTLLFYLSSKDYVVDKFEDANSYLFILPADKSTGRTLYPVNVYYKNGKLKSMAMSSSNVYNRLVYEGPYIEYYPNGNKKRVKSFTDGSQTGDIVTYYPNGELCSNVKTAAEGKMYLIDYHDSTGKVLCENGNGRWATVDTDRKELQEGPIKDGLKEGEWRVKIRDTLKYIVVYQTGIVQSSVDTKGEQLYEDPEKMPLPKFGMYEFYQYVYRETKYSQEAIDKKIHGRVLVTFVIERDGSVSNVTALWGPGYGLNESVAKAIAASDRWTPGYQNGEPVRVQYSMIVTCKVKSN